MSDLTTLFNYPNIKQLTPNDFSLHKNILKYNDNKKNNDGLIIIYADWCHNCKDKEPLIKFINNCLPSINEDTPYNIYAFNASYYQDNYYDDSNIKNILDTLNYKYFPSYYAVANNTILPFDDEGRTMLNKIEQYKDSDDESDDSSFKILDNNTYDEEDKNNYVDDKYMEKYLTKKNKYNF